MRTRLQLTLSLAIWPLCRVGEVTGNSGIPNKIHLIVPTRLKYDSLPELTLEHAWQAFYHVRFEDAEIAVRVLALETFSANLLVQNY